MHSEWWVTPMTPATSLRRSFSACTAICLVIVATACSPAAGCSASPAIAALTICAAGASTSATTVEVKFFQHVTFDETAEQLGVSPNTAKTRLYAALKKLRSQEGLKDAL